MINIPDHPSMVATRRKHVLEPSHLQSGTRKREKPEAGSVVPQDL